MKEKDGNFKIIAKEDYAGIRTTKDKVYEFKDGYTRWDGGIKSYCHYEDFEEFIKHNPGVANLFTKSTPPTELTTITIYNTPGSPKVSAVMRRGDTVIKSAKAICNPSDVFDYDKGLELSVKRLFGWEEVTKPTVPTAKEVVVVKRPAKVGEWIKVEESDFKENKYIVGGIYKVLYIEDDGRPIITEDNDVFGVVTEKYIVLENYQPSAPDTTVKFVKAKVGDRIKIVKVRKGSHSPKVSNGDTDYISRIDYESVRGKDGNWFYDKDEEYIIL